MTGTMHPYRPWRIAFFVVMVLAIMGVAAAAWFTAASLG
jgi:hypothetical protein